MDTANPLLIQMSDMANNDLEKYAKALDKYVVLGNFIYKRRDLRC